MDGTLLLTAFLDGKIGLWNKNTENVIEVNDPSGKQVWAIVWNPFLPNMFATRNGEVHINHITQYFVSKRVKI